ncbi:MAG: shikimate dehydrogenase [Chitinophagaceae bacterium]|jgi:shikimate dehydrogenase|nr:shikimate dehydrogenase [Chitinophagaceae bacterium]
MRLFGLIGYPLGHSFSKRYFTEKFSREGIRDAVYELFPLESIEQFPALWENHSSLMGLNVTIPYKESVIPYLDNCNDIVLETGACNCVLKKDGKLYGFNTDVIGFEYTLKAHLLPHHHQALVLGTGGAAKAVEYVLRKSGIEFRSVSRKAGAGQLAYDALDIPLIRAYPLIINTTPLGMYPAVENCPSIPYDGIGPGHLLIDLVYNPPLTRFMEQGIQRGAQAVNGESMLVLQAEESWKIWNPVG